MTAAWSGHWPDARPLGGIRYGSLGLPLAFVALPLYVILPKHYADAFGVPLAALGAVLLGARLLDAFADPLIGRWSDAWLGNGARRAWIVAAAAAVVLAIGFHGLFFPMVEGTSALLVWCAALLAVTYLSFSVVTVVHQAWGARLGGDAPQRARIVAWREGLALAGVMVATVLPTALGLQATSLAFAALLAVGMALLAVAPQPQASGPSRSVVPMSLPFRTPAFRKLLLIYLINGIASAIPATLVLFFIDDRLQATAQQPLFLAAYFAAGALSIPLWVRAVRRFGLPRTWLFGMVLAIGVFLWAALLGAGDVGPYLAVCILSGIALGADLTIPGAMVAGVIQRAGHGQQAEGAYFGWWNFATKLNLALAAGVALPALQWFGYAPGSRDPEALQALMLAYCVLPCVLKAAAVGLLYVLWIQPAEAE
jgi:glycoside/pentoside/hexuronide:cation symporter, GPH family